METKWNKTPVENGKTSYDFENYGTFDSYTITTPWRYIFSAATVIGKIGVIDVDLEIVDYSNNKIGPRSKNNDENNEIAAIYKTAINLKAGAEARLGPLYLRGGMAYYGNPYNTNQFDHDPILKESFTNTISYSAGIGFRNNDFYMDAAYTFMKHPEKIHDLYLYNNGANVEWIKLQPNYNKVLVTFGFRF